MRILAIESSCDETAAAVVEDGRRLLSNVVHSQIDIHAAYGGVVPEVAARSHIEVINPVVNQALTDAGYTWDDIDAIAVTYAPGLVGSLLIGTLAARTLAVVHNKPLYPIHHVEAHVYANFIVEAGTPDENRSTVADLTPPTPSGVAQEANKAVSSIDHLVLPSKQPDFPMLALIVSGGHSQLVLFRDHGDYELLGQTQDDAIGEAFDKVAKIIGLPYPGGPSVSKAALEGDTYAFTFPKANLKCTHTGDHIGMHRKAAASSRPNRTLYEEGAAQPTTQRGAQDECHVYDFSFSGLKTAVLRTVQREVGVDHTFPSHELPARVDDTLRANIAASFQRTAIETLVDKAEKAFRDYSPASVVIAGGVAANSELRRQLKERLPIAIEYAPMQLCTDNAAMIGALAYYQAQKVAPADPYTLDVVPSLSMTRTAWA